jgi:hypothetical protein
MFRPAAVLRRLWTLMSTTEGWMQQYRKADVPAGFTFADLGLSKLSFSLRARPQGSIAMLLPTRSPRHPVSAAQWHRKVS